MLLLPAGLVKRCEGTRSQLTTFQNARISAEEESHSIPLSLLSTMKIPGKTAIAPLLRRIQDFPGGAVDKNLPANAGDMGSSPGPGRSHMPRSN